MMPNIGRSNVAPWLSLLLVSCSFSFAHAQGAATLTGTVTDASGAVVSGATVARIGNRPSDLPG